MRKSYKMILYLYIVFVISFSINGVLCSAENVTVPNPLNFRMLWSQTMQSPQGNRSVYVDYSSLNKRSGVRSIIIKDREFIEGYKAYKGWDELGYDIYAVILVNNSRSSNYSLGYPESGDTNPNFGYSLPSPELMDGSYLYSAFDSYGYTSDTFGAFVIHSVVNYNNELNNIHGLTSTARWETEEIPCVTSVEDAYKYLFQNDDSVVKNVSTQPLPSETLDNALPVPQQVSLTTGDTSGVSNESNLVYRYGGIFLKWVNPQMASFDAFDNIKIQIKYKPKVKARTQVLRINKGIFTTSNFFDVEFSAFDNSENMVNNYYSYGLPDKNALNLGWGYGADMSGGYRFVDNDFNRAYNEISNSNNLGNFICDMVKGTQASIRYVADYQGNTYCSYWVDVGYGGSVLAPSSVSFSNASGDPVSYDDVDYTPSDQNISPNGDDASNSSLLDRLRNALFNIGQLPDDLNNIANEGSAFAKFLAKVWKEFPEIYLIFISGLIIAIILRILGR